MSHSGREIRLVTNEEQARRCFTAFQGLRPHLDEETFINRWREQSTTGYKIISIEVDGIAVAAAGFREMTTMAWGRILYLDDLIALPGHRGHGYGEHLLRFLQEEVRRRACDALHLDTGYMRHDAHRSYLRNGFEMICHHMAWTPAQG